MINSSSLLPINSKIGIYIHIPFCIHKCNYCDFYSITKIDQLDKFVENLVKEIRLFSSVNSKLVVDSIFFGGGTPSILEYQHFKKIFAELNDNFEISKDSEITIEANPGAVDIEILPQLKSFGVNRLSFGVQSFDDSELKFLQRIHNSTEAINSIIYAKKIGFDNISLDLIFGIPNQKQNSWQQTLKIASELDVQHISIYNLIYEEGTPLHKNFLKGKIKRISEDIEEEMYYYAVDFLEQLGYKQYELSNFAKNNKQCHHNIKYWTHQPYVGFGPSSHSFLGNKRYWNHRNLQKYFSLLSENQLPIEEIEELDKYKIAIERIMLGLRYDGVELAFISEIIKDDIEVFIKQNILPFRELFKQISPKISLTKQGYFLINEIAIRLINQIDLTKF